MNAEPVRSTSTTANGTAQHPAPLRHRVPLWALWFGLAGAPAAWGAQLLTSYALSAHNCYPRLVPLAVPEGGSRQLGLFLLAIFATAIAASVFALVTSIRSWRVTLDESSGDGHVALDVGDGRTQFMALGGILISSLFLIAVVAQGVLVLLVRPCA